MSYKRSYSTTLTVTGSRYVHYPASQNGGSMSVDFTERVPINVDIDVETYMFDRSIVNAGDTVNGLTGAVAAMNAAQCVAIKENSERISNSLIDGFYNMIKSDISMKQTENNSVLQSKIALLLELSKDVVEKHSRMEQDLERLRAHYGNIFKGLDEDLEKRLTDLDRPAFKLGQNTRIKVIKEPAVSAGAVTSDALNVNSQTESRLSCARIKKSISSALKTMGQSVKNSLAYKNKMNDILWRADNNQSETEYVPVIYYVIPSDNGEIDNYVTPPMSEANSVITNVSSYVRSKPLTNWKQIDPEEYNFIDQAFTKLVEQFSKTDQGENSDRVYSEILKLWNSSKTQITQIRE